MGDKTGRGEAEGEKGRLVDRRKNGVRENNRENHISLETKVWGKWMNEY